MAPDVFDAIAVKQLNVVNTADCIGMISGGAMFSTGALTGTFKISGGDTVTCSGGLILSVA